MHADKKNYREKYVSNATKIVVKVGTNVLSSCGQRPDEGRVGMLSDQFAHLVEKGKKIAVVSSGAVGYGMAELGLHVRPTTLPELQGTASVGQAVMVGHYDRHLRRHGLHAGQILLTHNDLDSRDRYLNASNTIHTLFEHNCIPIINENDSISTEEIQFGDNDLLAAYLTNLIRAELLIILTTAPGLYAHKPLPDNILSTHKKRFPNDTYVGDVVKRIDDNIIALDTGRTSSHGTGGMTAKLESARIATEAGEAALIADGHEENILCRLMDGEALGTLFLPTSEKLRSKKRWIRFTRRPQGQIHVDQGAEKALCERGKSLLPSGIVKVRGKFQPGDLVCVIGADGDEIARGLTNYSSTDIRKILGHNTSDIKEILGQKPYDEVVHRDNLALV
jgi:glutamate 5-kinase